MRKREEGKRRGEGELIHHPGWPARCLADWKMNSRFKNEWLIQKEIPIVEDYSEAKRIESDARGRADALQHACAGRNSPACEFG